MTKQSQATLPFDRDCRTSFYPDCNDAFFWIDSSGGPDKLCNLSLIGSNPKYYIYGSINEVTLHECETGAISFANENCFDFLEEKIKEEKVNNPNGIFVGYVSYDIFPLQQKSFSIIPSSRHPINKDYPNFFFAFYESYDNINNLGNEQEKLGNNSRTSYFLPLTSNMTDDEYLEKVKQIKEEIKKGNVYQVNLTREYSLQQWTVDSGQWAVNSGQWTVDSGQWTELDLYLKLRELSPNPYGCFFKTPFVTILSSSPEEFLYLGQQKNPNSTQSSILNPQSYFIRTRPVKGTLLKNTFEIDEKNKAENLMIVDLERNDLGRICKIGSVKVKELLAIEQYEHLNHVVSTVEGVLKENISLREIFEAVFPGGSITGAPKISAMKIIDKIEPTNRGAYTGSFGYIKPDGTMNFNILIRTIFIQSCMSLRAKRSNLDRDCRACPEQSVGLTNVPRNDMFHVTFNVGGGIVADSDPNAELEEIKLKAKGIMSTLQMTYDT